LYTILLKLLRLQMAYGSVLLVIFTQEDNKYYKFDDSEKEL